jgi:cAMP phosphodiesterase
MELKVLGCSGGIGGGLRTTSLLVDDDLLIDAGTGLNDLSVEALAKIDHVFITHAHLDHVACLPFMVDTVGSIRKHPVTVYALPEVLATLQTHLFNWKLWPDFTRIPTREKPYMRIHPIRLGESMVLDGRRIRPIPANHVVPAVGYHLDSGTASLVFSGDTTINDALWEAVNAIENLRYLIIETAFPDQELALAQASKHLCPKWLAEELSKPSARDKIISQVALLKTAHPLRILEHGQLFRF